MFRLHKFVMNWDEIEEKTITQEISIDAIEWQNGISRGRPPSYKVICRHAEDGVAIEFEYSSMLASSWFRIKFDHGLPKFLIGLTKEYCQKEEKKIYGDKSTVMSFLYFRRDMGKGKENFCQYFNEIENYFVNYFNVESSLSRDRMLRCFDVLRDSILLPKGQKVFSLQTYCMNTLFKKQQETKKDIISILPLTVQDQLKNSLIR